MSAQAEIVRAAVFRGVGEPLKVENITLDAPAATEVRVRMKAVGMCHTEQHVMCGELPIGMTPMVLGHEGAGIVEAVGSEVTDIVVGDHVALLWQPACQKCAPCKRGEHHRCEQGPKINLGPQLNGTYRRWDSTGEAVGALCMVGAFAEKTVVDQASVVVVDRDLPFDAVALCSCGVACGFGAMAHGAKVQTGETVLVVGAGGSGLSAVQAAAIAGASKIIVADLHQWKLECAQTFGATDIVLVGGEGDITGKVLALTEGVGVDHAVVCVGSAEVLAEAFRATKVGGSVVLSGIPPVTTSHIPLHPLEVLGGNGKTLTGSLYGAISPLVGIPEVLDKYRKGVLKIDEIITRSYSLDEVGDGYADLAAGENLRGLVRF
jgi:NDMA-dependent alcohol dehydrogenase